MLAYLAGVFVVLVTGWALLLVMLHPLGCLVSGVNCLSCRLLDALMPPQRTVV
jgi:hypothetical protein